MRVFVLTGLALTLQACVSTNDQDMVGKTPTLQEPQLRKLPTEPITDTAQERPQTIERDQNHYAFGIALVSYVEPNWRRGAVYENNSIKLIRGDDFTFEKKLTRQQSQRLNKIIETFDKEIWSGFYMCLDVLDGDIVSCWVNRGDEVLRFNGSNGSPKGFSALLSEIDAIVQKDFFPDDWTELENKSKRYESEDDMMRQFIDRYHDKQN